MATLVSSISQLDEFSDELPRGKAVILHLAPGILMTLSFDQAGTKTIHLRFVGPYPYPDDISVVLRVNGGEFYPAKLSCR